jgi:hypothetical protein
MRAVLPLLALLYTASPAAAQWYIGLELGATHYGGSAHDTSSGSMNPDGRPGDATMIGVRFSRGWARWGAAVRASYGRTGFALGTSDLDVTIGTTGRLFEFAGLLSTRVGGIGPSGAIRAELGPALHLWNFDDRTHARVGALGAAAYEWSVISRLIGAVRLEGLLSKSWFDAEDVPPELERRITWRYGVSLGLRYRL